jgi:hypothetical protein
MISTSSFITLCLFIFWVVAFLLSLSAIQIISQDIETTKFGRFVLIILTLVLTPMLWIIGLALIIDKIIRTTEK